MPSGEERSLLNLLAAGSLRRETLVQCVITESTKNKPLRTTLNTFMNLDTMKRRLRDREQTESAAEDSSAASASY